MEAKSLKENSLIALVWGHTEVADGVRVAAKEAELGLSNVEQRGAKGQF